MADFGINMQLAFLQLVPNYEDNKHLPFIKKTTLAIHEDQDMKKKLLHFRDLIQELENASSYSSMSKEEKQKMIDEVYALLDDFKASDIDLFPRGQDPRKTHGEFSKDQIDQMLRSEADEYEGLGNHIRQLLSELQSETTDMQNIIEICRNIRNEINRILENMAR